MNYFKDWQKISVDGADLDFYEKVENGVKFIGFDSSKCTPPTPMINAMVALNLVKDSSTQVVMINHKFPAGLIPKIEHNFNYSYKEFSQDLVEVKFWLKDTFSGEKIKLEPCGGSKC